MEGLKWQISDFFLTENLQCTNAGNSKQALLTHDLKWLLYPCTTSPIIILGSQFSCPPPEVSAHHNCPPVFIAFNHSCSIVNWSLKMWGTCQPCLVQVLEKWESFACWILSRSGDVELFCLPLYSWFWGSHTRKCIFAYFLFLRLLFGVRKARKQMKRKHYLWVWSSFNT